MIVARTTATRPAGRLPGSRTLAVQPTRMITNAAKATYGTSNICAAGRIEMNVIEIPASVPSIAARGVHLRIVGPMKAPIRTMMPMMNAHARPDSHARMAAPPTPAESLFFKNVGSMITKVTRNMCGTLGPYGIAATVVRPSFWDSL